MTLQIDKYTVTLHPELGSGTFGTVFLAVNNENKQNVAVKKIKYTNDDNQRNNEFMQMAFKEIKSTQKLAGNKNIIKLIEYHMDKHAYWIFMEYCELGDLHNYLKKKLPDQYKKIDIMYQCACAIDFMHSCNPPIIHRDIKTKNFLMTSQRGYDTVKVTDFGLAKLVDGMSDGQRSVYMNTLGGSYDYMAPEFFQSEIKYKASVDIFSLGLVYLVVQQYWPDSAESDLRPLSVSMRNQKAILSVGNEMRHAFDTKKPMPEVVCISDQDTSAERGIKDLITGMVAFESHLRLPIRDVKKTLGSLLEREGSSLSDDDSPSDAEGSIDTDQAGYQIVRSMIDTTERNGGSMNMLCYERSLSRESGTQGHFKRHDIVILQCDSKNIEQLQRGHGGFNPDMEQYIGCRGIVTVANQNGVSVKFMDGKSFVLNQSLLQPVNAAVDDLEAGDYVLVKPEKCEVEKIQKQPGSGGWIDDMDQLLGQSGIIRCVKGEKVKVEHTKINKSYVWNNKVLVLLAKGEDLLVHLIQQKTL